MSWGVRPDKRFRLAVGSFIEEYRYLAHCSFSRHHAVCPRQSSAPPHTTLSPSAAAPACTAIILSLQLVKTRLDYSHAYLCKIIIINNRRVHPAFRRRAPCLSILLQFCALPQLCALSCPLSKRCTLALTTELKTATR